MIYDQLKDVKIIYKTQSAASGWTTSWTSIVFGFDVSKTQPKEEEWLAVYHKEFKKWLVTNDIENVGLNEFADKIDIIGFATSVDGIMFVVWEHQKSLGMTRTIQEEIKDIKLIETMKTNKENNDWKWAKPSRVKSKGNKSSGTLFVNNTPFTGEWTITMDNEPLDDSEDNT